MVRSGGAGTGSDKVGWVTSVRGALGGGSSTTRGGLAGGKSDESDKLLVLAGGSGPFADIS